MSAKLPSIVHPFSRRASSPTTSAGIGPMTCVGCRQIRQEQFNSDQHGLCRGEDDEPCVPVRGPNNTELCIARADIQALQEQAQDNVLIAAMIQQFQVAAGRVCVTDRAIKVPVTNLVSAPISVKG